MIVRVADFDDLEKALRLLDRSMGQRVRLDLGSIA